MSLSYPVILLASVTLLTGAWVAIPQIYARARELLDAAGAPPALSLSVLRSPGRPGDAATGTGCGGGVHL